MAKKLIQETNACDLLVKALCVWVKLIHDGVNEIAGASLHNEHPVLSASFCLGMLEVPMRYALGCHSYRKLVAMKLVGRLKDYHSLEMLYSGTGDDQ